MHRSPWPLYVAIFTLTAAFFLTQWLLLPWRLAQSETRMAIVSAEYLAIKSGRDGRARLAEPSGRTAVISCGRVRALCAELRKGPIPAMVVWLQEPVLLSEPWVAAAIVQQRYILPAWQQAVLYDEFRDLNAVLAGTFAALAVAAFMFSRYLARNKHKVA